MWLRIKYGSLTPSQPTKISRNYLLPVWTQLISMEINIATADSWWMCVCYACGANGEPQAFGLNSPKTPLCMHLDVRISTEHWTWADRNNKRMQWKLIEYIFGLVSSSWLGGMSG